MNDLVDLIKGSKHTPGPWQATACTTRDGYIIGQSVMVTPYRERCVTYPNIAHTLDEANARLIAAAPELLEAAKAMVASGYVMDADSPEWLPLQAAIAKAEGSAEDVS